MPRAFVGETFAVVVVVVVVVAFCFLLQMVWAHVAVPDHPPMPLLICLANSYEVSSAIFILFWF